MIGFLLFFLSCHGGLTSTFSQKLIDNYDLPENQNLPFSEHSEENLSSMDVILKKCLLIIGFFETSSEGFDGVAGSFDGQGVSWGVFQWNFGQGTLQPLLADILLEDPKAVQEIFGSRYGILKQLAQSSVAQALDLCHQHVLVGSEVQSEWRQAFQELGRLPVAQKNQIKHGDKYIATTQKEMKLLNFKTVRSYLTLLQNNVQNGFTYISGKDPVSDGYRYWLKSHGSASEKEKLTQLMEYLIQEVNPQWQEVVRARVETCINNTGFVNGQNLNLEQDFGIDLDANLPEGAL